MTAGRRQRGFTYLAALFLVAIAGVGIATMAETWSNARQREKEVELLWTGDQFKQAIGLYYERTPAVSKRFPESLEDLVQDRRFATVQRYLRRVYADPVTGRTDWELIAAPQGGIQGVRSRSTKRPVGRMSSVAAYADWTFTYQPQTATLGTKAGPAP